jgi:hypothetical protein
MMPMHPLWLRVAFFVGRHLMASRLRPSDPQIAEARAKWFLLVMCFAWWVVASQIAWIVSGKYPRWSVERFELPAPARG